MIFKGILIGLIFGGGFKHVWNSCFYTGSSNMKFCEKVERGADKR